MKDSTFSSILKTYACFFPFLNQNIDFCAYISDQPFRAKRRTLLLFSRQLFTMANHPMTCITIRWRLYSTYTKQRKFWSRKMNAIKLTQKFKSTWFQVKRQQLVTYVSKTHRTWLQTTQRTFFIRQHHQKWKICFCISRLAFTKLLQLLL